MNILTLSSLAITAACNETDEQSTKLRTINAVIVQPETKTSLDGPDANGVYKTVWSSRDEIKVFSGNSEACRFTLKSGENTNKGVFEGYSDSNDLVAIYPLSIGHSRSGGTINVGLPEVQEYVSGNIPQGAYPMLGTYSDETFSFSNLCSVLKVPMYGDATVKSITFTPNNASVKASGGAVIRVSQAKMEMAADANSSVKLDCPDVKLSAEPTDFHFVVPAQKYPGGFTLTIATDQGAVVKAVKSDVTLSRSVLYPIKAFECKIDDSKDNIVFEDANFKAYLVKIFDKDNDGEISYDEAMNITNISVNTINIKSLAGIEHMPNLTFLDCNGPFKWDSGRGKYVGEGGQLKSLDVSHNPKLGSLYCGFNELTDLDVSNLTSLTRLYCDYNKLTSINLDNTRALRQLKAYNNNLPYINFRNSKNLTYIDVENNQLKSIDVTQNPNLTYLDCDGNMIQRLDISNNVNLTTLSCYLNNLYELDLTHNAKLEILDCGRNKITSLGLSNCPELKNFWCRNGSLTEIDLNCCPKLEDINVFNNKIETLDISEITGLNKFDCAGNPLQTLYIHEGQIDAIATKNIPSTTKIVVRGSEEPEEWASKEFWHKSLAMKFTATWCAPCATMAGSMEKSIALYPNKIEEINFHNDTDFPFGSYSGIASIFHVNSFPSVFVDQRKRVYNNDNAPSLLVEAVKETESNYPTKTGISFTSTVTGNTLDLNIKLYIKDKGDYKVTAVLLEDGLVATQNGAGDNFVHNHTARLAITDITGDAFTTTINNRTLKKSYSVTLPSSYNKDNLRILVYVLKQYGSQKIIRTDDYGDYYVDNATSAAIGTTKDLIFADGSANGGNEDTKDGGEITLK